MNFDYWVIFFLELLGLFHFFFMIPYMVRCKVMAGCFFFFFYFVFICFLLHLVTFFLCIRSIPIFLRHLLICYLFSLLLSVFFPSSFFLLFPFHFLFSTMYIVSSSIHYFFSLTHLSLCPSPSFLLFTPLLHSFPSFILTHTSYFFSPCLFSSFSSLKPLRQRGKTRERTVVIRLRVLERKHGGVLFVPAVSRIFHFRCYFIIILYFF